MNGIEPQAYLTDVIARIVAGRPQSGFDDLLPWVYAQQFHGAVAAMPTLTCSEPPGEAMHRTGRAVARAIGVSLRAVQRIWAAYSLQPHRLRTFTDGAMPTNRDSKLSKLTQCLSCLGICLLRPVIECKILSIQHKGHGLGSRPRLDVSELPWPLSRPPSLPRQAVGCPHDENGQFRFARDPGGGVDGIERLAERSHLRAAEAVSKSVEKGGITHRSASARRSDQNSADMSYLGDRHSRGIQRRRFL